MSEPRSDQEANPSTQPNRPSASRGHLEGYKLVRKPREESPDHEVRITSTGRISNYVSYIARLFDQERDTVVIRATGRPISMSVAVAEVVKRRFKNLHQLTTIGMTDIVDTYEPLEGTEGETKTVSRSVPYISVTLTTNGASVDKEAVGYQKPLPEEMVNELPLDEVVRSNVNRPRSRKPRRRVRGPSKNSAGEGDSPQANGRPRGRRSRRQKDDTVISGQTHES
ncbi:MAG: hypothetical protein KVP17_003717 [Porospora cf. gigantea B]|uniref:uncharacterized protein n=1 Tax=Porospora cf. gigantea B TaxID=2853592 RepID=UPI0035719245|nr:MAG: hypothetical protein KVP17_003717 [Porospora cf. gigantea B]